MKKPFGFLVFPALFSLGFVATATTVIPPTFDELVSRAQTIFEGEVTGVQSQWIGEGSEHRIVTFVTFKVYDSLKGDPGTTGVATSAAVRRDPTAGDAAAGESDLTDQGDE